MKSLITALKRLIVSFFLLLLHTFDNNRQIALTY